MGLAAVKGFLGATGLKRAVLFTADPYSKVVDRNDHNTALIFGDAATVSLIKESDLWQIGAFDLGTEGKRHEVLMVNGTGALVPAAALLRRRGLPMSRIGVSVNPRRVICLRYLTGAVAVHQGR